MGWSGVGNTMVSESMDDLQIHGKYGDMKGGLTSKK